jgi:hypothetical protein
MSKACYYCEQIIYAVPGKRRLSGRYRDWNGSDKVDAHLDCWLNSREITKGKKKK